MKKPAPRTLLSLLALSLVVLAACAATAQPAGGPATGYAPDAAGKAIAVSPLQGAPAAPESQDARTGGVGGQPPAVPVPQIFESERALILTASVALQAKDSWGVADRVQAIAIGLGGDVMSLSQSGSGEQRNALLTVRVPQSRFNDALRQIREIADVEVVSSSVEGKDVTDQFVDLQARLTAKQAEEQRYIALLARANTIDEILKIDQSLAQVRLQIEQLTAQINFIKARTTYSTITVQVSPVLPQPKPVPDPTVYDPSETFERALTALASVMRSVLDAAIWTLVFGWIPLLVFGLVLLLSRTRERIVPSA